MDEVKGVQKPPDDEEVALPLHGIGPSLLSYRDILYRNIPDWRDVPRLPLGEDLCTALRDWLPHAQNILEWPVIKTLNWAIGGRVLEVLAYLEASNNPLDLKVAQAIREIGARDRVIWGYGAIIGNALYGWVGRALGNRTWIEKKWWQYHGDARKAYEEHYGMEPEPAEEHPRQPELRPADEVTTDAKLPPGVSPEEWQKIVEMIFSEAAAQFSMEYPDDKKEESG